MCRLRQISHLAHHPAVRRGMLLLLTACVISLLFHDAPLSRLLATEDGERHRLLTENEERLQHSELFLDNYRKYLNSPNSPRRLGAAPEPDIGLTVLTMARGRRMSRHVTYRTQYLTQSLASLFRLLNDSSLTFSYRLSVCDVDDRPELFTEARVFEDIVPFFKRFGDGPGSAKRPDTDTVWEKLKHDYVYCLQQTLSLGVRYVLLIEDDAIAHAHLLSVVEHVLGHVVESRGKNVTYIKLFHPERLLGYVSLEVERLTELVSLSLVLGALLAFACSRSKTNGVNNDLKSLGTATRRDDASLSRGCYAHLNGSTSTHTNTRSNSSSFRRLFNCAIENDTKHMLTSWAGWAIVVALSALIIGRVNLLELRRLSPQLYQVTPAPFCCTPAMLFTQNGGKEMSEYLQSVTCTAKKSTDYWMDQFKKASKDRALLVQPNLVKHIGMVSSLRTKEVSPLLVQ